MNAAILNYFLEVNICLLIFGGMYFLLFKFETDFKFRRFYLLAMIMVSLIAPLLHFTGFESNIPVVSEIETVLLPEITIGEKATENTSAWSSSYGWIKTGYWVGTIIAAQFFIFQLMQLVWFLFSKKVDTQREGKLILINTNGTLPTFSFFNLLFFDNSIELSDEDKNKIIKHEKVHIFQKHSIDIILVECTKIFFWFNPVIWAIKNELQNVHEYMADQKLVQEACDQNQYASLLAKMALNKAHLSLGNHFNKSKTLKRIEMMKKSKHNVNPWKLMVLIPLISATVFMISCNDEIMEDVDAVMETASQIEMPEELEDELAGLQNKYPKADFTYIEADGSSESSISNLKDLDPASIGYIKVFEGRERIGVIVNKKGSLKTYASKTKVDGDVFAIVDNPAMPDGGYKAFYERIGSSLKYPKQARKMGVEGKVYVQFVIDETGAVTDLKVVKGIGAGCDQVAAESVAKAGSWSVPMQNGKAVKQRIILPITFALDDVDEEEG